MLVKHMGRIIHMKNRLSILLAVSIAALLFGCGEVSEDTSMVLEEPLGEVTVAQSDKYGDLYDLLEKSDYNGAIAYIESLKPEVEVELTVDNLMDYYEFQFVTTDWSSRDAVGTVTNIDIFMEYELVLRDEYRSRAADDDKLTVGIEYDLDQFVPCRINESLTDLIVYYDRARSAEEVSEDAVKWSADMRGEIAHHSTMKTEHSASHINITGIRPYHDSMLNYQNMVEEMIANGGDWWNLERDQAIIAGSSNNVQMDPQYAGEEFYLIFPRNISIKTVEGRITLKNCD